MSKWSNPPIHTFHLEAYVHLRGQRGESGHIRTGIAANIHSTNQAISQWTVLRALRLCVHSIWSGMTYREWPWWEYPEFAVSEDSDNWENVKYVDVLPIQYVLYILHQTVFYVLSDSNGLFTNLCVLWLESEPVPVGNESASDGNSDGLWTDYWRFCIWSDSRRCPQRHWGSSYRRSDNAVVSIAICFYNGFVLNIYRVSDNVMALIIGIIGILLGTVVNAGTLYTQCSPWLLDPISIDFWPIRPNHDFLYNLRTSGKQWTFCMVKKHWKSLIFCMKSRSQNIPIKM